ncbi:thioredoxin [Oceanicaulis alexandrii]|uniref:thioredoxin n=1 Tax=Oceanicaulis alexandrii TaxID=153233 RepID=UPI0035D0ACD6
MENFGTNSHQAPAGADLIKDGADQTFMTDVIEPSKDVPVLVDFWAPWCGPCRQLGPTIERAVSKAGGKVKLVKVNIDENPGIAGQLRIQSIPAVIAFKDGQPVDGFMGALPESQVNDFINRMTGEVSEEEVTALVERAQEALDQGDLGGAAQDFATALQMDKDNAEALAGMARVHLAGGDPVQAKAILDNAPETLKSAPAIAAVRASMELAGEAQDAPEVSEAEAAVHRTPDAGTWHALGRARLGAGDMDGAAEALLELIAMDRDYDDAAARQLLLRVFESAGAGSELAKNGRRRLSSILFS